MFKFGFSLLFAVLLTCDCYSSSEELIEALTEGTIEHEIANVDVENPSEGSTENHEYQEEYIMKDNIDERGDAGGNESHASMNEYESKEGEPMSIDDPAETDPDENGDETEEDKDDLQEDVYSEGKNHSISLLLVSLKTVLSIEKAFKANSFDSGIIQFSTK